MFEIIKELRLLRIKKGYTQKFIAKYLDVSVKHISQIELGNNTLRPDKMDKLLQLYDYHLKIVKNKK